MTPEQISLIENTWPQVSGSPEEVALLFYGRLFEQTPQLRPLFKGNIAEQGRKLMSSLTLVVSNLARPEALSEPIRRLGMRHKDYSVLPEHYPLVGAALLWTLKQGLGEEFTPEVEKAWSEAFELVASAMLEAAAAVRN